MRQSSPPSAGGCWLATMGVGRRLVPPHGTVCGGWLVTGRHRVEGPGPLAVLAVQLGFPAAVAGRRPVAARRG